jgi:hypothetical protein
MEAATRFQACGNLAQCLANKLEPMTAATGLWLLGGLEQFLSIKIESNDVALL